MLREMSQSHLETTVQTPSADEDHVKQKVPEKLLNGPCGEIVLSNTTSYYFQGQEQTLNLSCEFYIL